MKTLAIPSLQIRCMQQRELARNIGWAAQEGWNPGLNDSQSFYSADPEGFLLAETDGQAVAMISAVRYGANFGFIGFYIVRPEFRGRGYGLAIWNAGMERLKGRLVGLDGVVAQQDNYRKSGFVLAYNNMRMQGSASTRGPIAPQVRKLETNDLEALVQYDAAMFPAERAGFIRHWVQQPLSIALGWVEQGVLRGYGVIRPCHEGSKIGPLFADDAHTAEQLVNALMGCVPQGSQVQWDMSCEHPQARSLAESWGMRPGFETARMYTGSAPVFDLQRQFGITSFELG
jgi:GNAT superfamily N-acetyltransferase